MTKNCGNKSCQQTERTFYRCSKSKSGYQSWCVICTSERLQQYRNNLKEKLTIESNLNLVIKDISDVQEAVQKTFNLQDDFINAGKGNRGSGLYRQVVFYLLKYGKGMSSRNIATRLRFDPKSINVGLKYFENTMKINTELKDAVSKLLTQMQSK